MVAPVPAPASAKPLPPGPPVVIAPVAFDQPKVSSANPFGRASPSPTAPPSGGPSFAPLPPLPPLGRAPTSAGIPGIGAPPGGQRAPTGEPVPGVGLARPPTGTFPAPGIGSAATPGFPAQNVAQQQSFQPSFQPSLQPSFQPSFQPSSFQQSQPNQPGQPSYPLPQPPQPHQQPHQPQSSFQQPSFQQQQQPSFQQQQQPFQQPPSFQPPGFQPATFEPPSGRSAGPPVSAPLAPSRPAVLNAPRASPRNDVPSSSAASASNLNDEQTVDVERVPVPKWRRNMRRLYSSPAVFGIAFVLGFLVTFGPGALVMLRSPDAAALLAADKLDDVITLLQARERARSMEPHDWLVYGHALNRRYGSLQRVRMLDKYAQAVREKSVDSTALENTINALADEKAHDRAMVVVEDWPASGDPQLDPNRRLAAHVTDDNYLLRHSAVEALKKRNAPAQLVFAAVAASALQDVKSQDCTNDIAKNGMLAILDLTTRDPADARAAFGAANPMPHLLRLGPAELVNMRCVDQALLTKTRNAVSKFDPASK